MLTGPDDICSYRLSRGGEPSWGGAPDVIAAFVDPRRADEADGDTVVNGVVRVQRYLRAHFPAAARHCDFDPDDVAYYTCTRRTYAIDVVFAVARIHATVKARWTVPATAGALS